MTPHATGPAIGTRAVLVFGRHDRVPVRVDDRGTGWFDVELVDPYVPSFMPDCRAVLEFAGSEGTGQVVGRLQRTPNPGVLRLAHTAPVQLTRRREFVRSRVAAPVTVMRLGPDSTATRAVTVDITGAGMTLRGIPYAATGQLYTFELELRDLPLIEGQFRVQRVDGELVSAAFTVLDARDRGALVRYAADHPARPGYAA
jgi:hypothetical protein